MARTKNSKWNIWLLALAAMVAPAVMSARSQVEAAAPGVSELNPPDAEAAPEGICPFYCNSAAQCTTGCQTEALCQLHRCWPL